MGDFIEFQQSILFFLFSFRKPIGWWSLAKPGSGAANVNLEEIRRNINVGHIRSIIAGVHFHSSLSHVRLSCFSALLLTVWTLLLV